VEECYERQGWKSKGEKQSSHRQSPARVLTGEDARLSIGGLILTCRDLGVAVECRRTGRLCSQLRLSSKHVVYTELFGIADSSAAFGVGMTRMIEQRRE
jgi:hypothetical protein